MPAKKNHASGEGSHQTFPLKITKPWIARHYSRGGVVHSGYRGTFRT
ncbi:integrase [Escherichia sp. MOD1-EC6475]|nr:integrase [Escherichia sp. MOD1-EC6475]